MKIRPHSSPLATPPEAAAASPIPSAPATGELPPERGSLGLEAPQRGGWWSGVVRAAGLRGLAETAGRLFRSFAPGVAGALLGGNLPIPPGAPQSALGRVVARAERGESSRTELLEAVERPGGLAGLAPFEAKRAIELLARGPTPGRAERAIVAVLAALDPLARGEVLRLLGGGGDRYTVHHLLDTDLDDAPLRARAALLIGEARRGPRRERVVISDFDDTLSPRRDPRFSGPVFPGARALLAAFDVERDGGGSPGDVHVVTARPMGAGAAVRGAGIAVSSVSGGTLLSGLRAEVGDLAGLRDRKVENIERLLARNPEAPVVLMGDNLQADHEVFLKVLAQHPERVEAVLLRALPDRPVPPALAADPRTIVFVSYADAALELHRRGLITAPQLEAVLADVRAAVRPGG